MATTKPTLWKTRTDSVWVAMIIIVIMLWGGLASINRIKRQTSELRSEVTEFHEQHAKATDERLALLSTRMDSIEFELKRIRDTIRSIATQGASGPDPVKNQEYGDYSAPQHGDSIPIHDDPHFKALSEAAQESLLARRDQFIATLDEAELDELGDRTKAFVDATIQKTMQTIPNDLHPNVLEELERNREHIHRQLSPVIIQQMMLEHQSNSETSSPGSKENQ